MSMQVPKAYPAAISIRGREFAWGSRTFLMGVINVSRDSFSGDGVANIDEAVQRARTMVEQGADIIDVGGESTRPGFQPASTAAERDAVVPVIVRLVDELDVPISVDTTKAEVARAALDAGASIVNDVNGLRGDVRAAPTLASVAAEHGAVVVAMHNQRDRPHLDVIGDIQTGLRESLAIAEAAGIAPARVIVDPGFGFGWRVEQNLEILRRLSELRDLGRPILVGTSRKSTIGHVLDLPVDERVEGTAATVALAIANGADIVRVHDVKEMVRAARMGDAIVRGWDPEEMQGD
jgi:dihydropteroate synthase